MGSTFTRTFLLGTTGYAATFDRGTSTHLRRIHTITICDEMEDDENVYHVLVVTHGGIVREFLKHIFSLEEFQALGAQWDTRGGCIDYSQYQCENCRI